RAGIEHVEDWNEPPAPLLLERSRELLLFVDRHVAEDEEIGRGRHILENSFGVSDHVQGERSSGEPASPERGRGAGCNGKNGRQRNSPRSDVGRNGGPVQCDRPPLITS